MSELLNVKSMVEVFRMLGCAVLESVDTRYANALNPPEVDYPRFHEVKNVERPVLTEEELQY